MISDCLKSFIVDGVFGSYVINGETGEEKNA